MTRGNEMTTEGTTTTELGYTITRTFDAPVEKVWHVWTTPEHYAQWFNARPESVRLDVRTGGSWESTLIAPDGSEYEMSGSYTEVEENKRMVMTMDAPGAEPSVMDFRLSETGGKTQVVVSQECASVEERDMSKEGSEYLLASFSDYLTKV
ncbi:MAG: SRPBCC family protein [Nocardioidaceae bacterium]